MKNILSLLSIFVFFGVTFSQTQTTDELKTANGPLKITPIQHASMMLRWNNKTIYVDPAGDTSLYKGGPAADIIIITDIHGDHMDLNALRSLDLTNAIRTTFRKKFLF
jgi:L-ascorbate metabolism protein UlaG (beta-lactamase superfamily)